MVTYPDSVKVAGGWWLVAGRFAAVAAIRLDLDLDLDLHSLSAEWARN